MNNINEQDVQAFPHCPKCGTTLQQVEYPGGMLNEDQWRSTRAGDWFCVTCKSDKARTGYLYFWNRELMTPMERGVQDAKETRAQMDARRDSISDGDMLARRGIGKQPPSNARDELERVFTQTFQPNDMRAIARLLNSIESSHREFGRRECEVKLENVVSERDAAEEFASQIYFIVTGHSPEWSNTFGFEQAAQEIEDAINLLKQAAKPAKLFPQV